MVEGFIPQKEHGAWNSAEERKKYFDRLETDRLVEAEAPKCTCGIEQQPDYAEIRERHGVETHSPYCSVGIAERAAV